MKEMVSTFIKVCCVIYVVLMPVLGSSNLREIAAKAVPLSHRALSVTPSMNVTAVSALQCAKFCIQHQCQSFNFANPSTCELLDTYLCRDSVVLEVRFGYMYYDVEWGVDVQTANDFRHLSDCIDQGRCSPKCYTGTTSTQASTTITTTQSTTTPSTVTTSAPTTASSTTTSTSVAPTTTSTTSTTPPTTATSTTTTTSAPTTTTTTTSITTTTAGGVPVNSPCITDLQCLVTFTSCRQNTCLCLPGYSFKPSVGTCVTIGRKNGHPNIFSTYGSGRPYSCTDCILSCGTLGTSFTVTVDYYINNNNLAIFDVYTQSDCELECIANPNCHSFDYNWMSLTCYIAGVTKLDVSSSFWTNDISFEYHQRNCA